MLGLLIFLLVSGWFNFVVRCGTSHLTLELFLFLILLIYIYVKKTLKKDWGGGGPYEFLYITICVPFWSKYDIKHS